MTKKVAVFLLVIASALPLGATPPTQSGQGSINDLKALIAALTTNQTSILATNLLTQLRLQNGGTGANLSATGGTSFVLRQSGVGSAVTVSQLAASDLSNGTSGSGAVALVTSPVFTTPNIGSATGSISGNAATATALAGSPTQCAANNFSTGVASSGNANCAQPTAANLTNGTTGSGAVVLATSPTLVTPTIGVATATSVNKVAFTPPASSATLAIADGKTLTASNSLTLAGTDATTMTFPTTSASIARTDATAQTFLAPQTVTTTTANPFTVTRPTAGVGTVSVVATQNTINAIGTNFLSYLQVGDTVTLSNGDARVVSAVPSDTLATITGTWPNTCNNCTYTVPVAKPIIVTNNGVAITSALTPTPSIPFRVGASGSDRFTIDSTGNANTYGHLLIMNPSAGDATVEVLAIGDTVGQSVLYLDAGNGVGSSNKAYVMYEANGASDLRWQSGLLGSDTNWHLKLTTPSTTDSIIANTTGQVGIGGAPSFPLHVIKNSGNQIVSEFDSTHRSSLWADATNGHVGTITSTPFRIATNSTDALFVDTSQKVGIGAAPQTTFDVQGAGTKASTIANWNADIFDTRTQAQGVGGGLLFSGYTTTQTVASPLASVEGSKTNGSAGNLSGDLVLKSASSAGTLTEGLRLDTNQKVTLTSPAATTTKHTLTGTTTASNSFEFTNTSGDVAVGVQDSTSSTFATGMTAYAGFFGSVANKPIHFFTNNTLAMTIDASQNVGIATTSPSSKFDVSGIMRSTASSGAPSTGAGVELFYTGTTGGVQAFDRSGAVFKPFVLAGSTVSLNRTGTAGAADLGIDSSGNTLMAGTLATYGGQTTAGRGIAPILATVTLTAQSASIGTTNLLAAPTAGLYRVCYYHEIAAAAATSSATQLTIGYTAANAQTQTGSNITGNTVGSQASGCITARVTAGALTYATSYASNLAATMTYNLNIVVERLQ